jgi:hypothetical protein
MFVLCDCCMMSGRDLCGWPITRPEVGRSLVQRTVLPNVVCLSVTAKPRQRGGPGQLGAVAPWEKNL